MDENEVTPVVDDSQGADSGVDEPVQEPVVPTDSAPETVEEPTETVTETVSEPTTYYSPDGDVIALTELPAASERTVNVGSSISGTPYSSVVNSTYEDVAAQIVPKMGFADDYLFVCTDSAEYVLCWGDITLAGTVFSADSVSYARFYSSSSYRGYQVEFGTASLNVDAGPYIVNSNLGSYPQLGYSDSNLTGLVGFAMVVCVAMYVMRSIFRWSLRSRVAVSHDMS